MSSVQRARTSSVRALAPVDPCLEPHLWTCVIVSSWSTLGTIKPDLLGVNLLIRHRFLLSENESVPQMILMHFMLLRAQTDEHFHRQETETEEVSQFPSFSEVCDVIEAECDSV
ncbi:hypothetical protein ILYODFUR_037936 [Ilyodon furcidens]|uniref:Uncharacterized protein n=1 Tax=Ilyodon furcidens TaxID=33524 RepID=A0ABV0V0C1_9TELE